MLSDYCFQSEWEIRMHFPFIRKYVLPKISVVKSKAIPIICVLSELCDEKNMQLYGKHYVADKLANYLQKYPERTLDWYNLYKFSDLVLEDIISFPLFPFPDTKWCYISNHPNLTIDLINKYPAENGFGLK